MDLEPKVVRVVPAHGRIPANLRRLRVVFSEPMRSRFGSTPAHRAVKLVDAGGHDIDAFERSVAWNGDRTAVTFKLRKPKAGERPFLAAGASIRLVVTTSIRSVAGLPPRRRFEHRFQVGPAREAPIDPRLWKVAPPALDSRDPLAIGFPYPLDTDSVEAHVRTVDLSGERVQGSFAVAPTATSIAFRPAAAWRPGPVFVVIDHGLRDDVGNGLVAPFSARGAVFEVLPTRRAEPFEVGPALFPAVAGPAAVLAAAASA